MARRLTEFFGRAKLPIAAIGLMNMVACSPAPVKDFAPVVTAATERNVLNGTIRVMTLNVAHGRKEGRNQLLQGKEHIRNNLVDIAEFLKRNGADVVALQEADAPSRWSGNFDHVALLAQRAEYRWYCRIGHAQTWLFDYGTALLSQGYFIDTLAHTFQPTPPTMTKGFLLGRVAWKPNEDSDHIVPVDFVSVHLDFSSEANREEQIGEMMESLSDRMNPIVILGDFNSEWLDRESAVEALARRLGLRAYRPQAQNLGTYPQTGRRLDWILISKELEFKSYAVLPDAVSDHYAVVAEVALKEGVDLKNFTITDRTFEMKSCKGDEICNTCMPSR